MDCRAAPEQAHVDGGIKRTSDNTGALAKDPVAAGPRNAPRAPARRLGALTSRDRSCTKNHFGVVEHASEVEIHF